MLNEIFIIDASRNYRFNRHRNRHLGNGRAADHAETHGLVSLFYFIILIKFNQLITCSRCDRHGNDRNVDARYLSAMARDSGSTAGCCAC